jgi:hypothetical protein
VSCGRSPFSFPRRIAKTPRQRVNHEIPAERYSRTLSKRRRVRMSLLPKRSRATPRKCRKFGQILTASKDYFHCISNYLAAGWGARIRNWEWRKLPYRLARLPLRSRHCRTGKPTKLSSTNGLITSDLRSRRANKEFAATGAMSFLCTHRLQMQPHPNCIPVRKLDAKRLEGTLGGTPTPPLPFFASICEVSRPSLLHSHQ